MSRNVDTQAAWHYHNGTKHPGGRLMNDRHFYDASMRPLLFKIYQELEPIPLVVDKSPVGAPTLAAMTESVRPTGEPQIPDLGTLARLLYFSAGITKRIHYNWGEMAFRAAACTGALYHIELYVVCGDLPGLAAGIYHFEPQDNSLKQLRQGDYRQVLVKATDNEPGVAQAPAILIYTDVFFRNAIKYQAREYRHAFWDSGTILSHTLAMAAAHDLPAKVIAGFIDSSVNRLLDLDPAREAALALAPIGHDPDAAPDSAPPVAALDLETEAISRFEMEIPAIRQMHAASGLADAGEVRIWRGNTPVLPLPEPTGDLIPLQPLPEDALPRDPLEDVIVGRGSTRQFSRESISFQQFSTLLTRATQGIPADYLEPAGLVLYHVYLIVNAVDGLTPGAYVYHRERQALELLKSGDFRGRAGYLGLGQDLAADASVDVFFLTDLEPVLARFGNRGYRVAQLDASVAAGKVYLAAYAQKFGASGLTFFDDAVTDFFSPHAAGKSVMFMVLLGKKARRR